MLLADLFGSDARTAGARGVLKVEIHAVCVEDPTESVEDLLRELSQAEFGPLPTAYREPPPKVGGRRECCRSFLRDFDPRLAHLRYPLTLTCPTCDAVYEVAPRPVMGAVVGR